MNGLGGRPGWAWIFILEGLLTVVVSLIAFWALADSPRTASFLTAEEAKEVEARLKNDNDELADHYDVKFMYHAFVDWKIWMQSMFVAPRERSLHNMTNLKTVLILAFSPHSTRSPCSCHQSFLPWASPQPHLSCSLL
jgi:hypothetical protein